MVTPEEHTGAIVGHVLFPDGTPVVGAKVVGAKVVGDKVGLSNASGQRAVETSTNSRGRFAVLGLAPGLYRVAVEHNSVAAVERTVQVPPGREVRVELVLAVAGRRESVTVTATLDPRQGRRSALQCDRVGWGAAAQFPRRHSRRSAARDPRLLPVSAYQQPGRAPDRPGSFLARGRTQRNQPLAGVGGRLSGERPLWRLGALESRPPRGAG